MDLVDYCNFLSKPSRGLMYLETECLEFKFFLFGCTLRIMTENRIYPMHTKDSSCALHSSQKNRLLYLKSSNHYHRINFKLNLKAHLNLEFDLFMIDSKFGRGKSLPTW